jgi:Uncharacterized protein conserved in bacteria (DUF2334)
VIASAQADADGDRGARAKSRRDADAQNQLRSARLLFDAELSAGTLQPLELRAPTVVRATRVRAVPSRAVRVGEQLRYKLGQLDYESGVMAPLRDARRAVLGQASATPSRLLVRVDEFPHYRAWDEPTRYGTAAFERFHEIMAGAGVSYLVALLPRVSREPLSPSAHGSRPLQDDEVATLRRIAGEGVSFALHGRDHRTRARSPRRHSELCGLSPAATAQLLAEALAELTAHGLSAPEVFVPPYNRFDARQFQLLARHFQVVCGGPESIGTLGFHRGPQWRGDAVYLPSYAPVYGTATGVLAALEWAIAAPTGLWIPVSLHWGWELSAGWSGLQRLVGRIAEHTAPWGEFLQAIGRSREPAGARDAAGG